MSAPQGKFSIKRYKACYRCKYLTEAKNAHQSCPSCHSRQGFTSNFTGMTVVMEASQSWSARHQGIRRPGMYALAVAKPAKRTKNDDGNEEQDEYDQDDFDNEDRLGNGLHRQNKTKSGGMYDEEGADELQNRPDIYSANFDMDDNDDDDDEIQLNINMPKKSTHGLNLDLDDFGDNPPQL